MLKYIAVEGRSLEAGNPCSGIAAYEGNCLVEQIGDITPDHAEAEQLAQLLNRLGASLLHFHDIVEDFVIDRSLVFF